MGQVLALHELVAARQVWHARSARPLDQGIPTGFTALDDALPLGGWPKRSLTELLLPTLTQQCVAPGRAALHPLCTARGRRRMQLPRLDILDASRRVRTG